MKRDDERKAKAASLRDRLLSAAAGAASVAPSTLGASLLAAPLVAGVTQSGPTVSSAAASDYSRRYFGRDQPVMIGPGRESYFTRYISVPEEPGGRVRLPLIAHEAGHAHGGILQQIARTVGDTLFVLPRVGGTTLPVQLSPLHIPLALAATAPVKKDESGILAWIKRNPAVLAGLLAAIPMVGEAHASLRGLGAITRSHGIVPAIQSAVPMARAFGAHALTHVPAVAGLWAASKVRDLLQKWRDSKAEDKEREVAKEAGMIGRVADRPLLGTYQSPARWSDEPMLNTPSILIRPKGKAERGAVDRTEILQTNTSVVPGVNA